MPNRVQKSTPRDKSLSSSHKLDSSVSRARRLRQDHTKPARAQSSRQQSGGASSSADPFGLPSQISKWREEFDKLQSRLQDGQTLIEDVFTEVPELNARDDDALDEMKCNAIKSFQKQMELNAGMLDNRAKFLSEHFGTMNFVPGDHFLLSQHCEKCASMVGETLSDAWKKYAESITNEHSEAVRKGYFHIQSRIDEIRELRSTFAPAFDDLHQWITTNDLWVKDPPVTNSAGVSLPTQISKPDDPQRPPSSMEWE